MPKGADDERLKNRISQLIKKEWLPPSYRKEHESEFIKNQLASAIRIHAVAAMQP